MAEENFTDNPSYQYSTNGNGQHYSSFEEEYESNQDTEDFMEATGELLAYVKEYVNDRIEYIKLDVAEKTATTTSSVVTILVLSVVGILALVFGSTALGLFLGERLDSYALGFAIVFGIYVVVGLALYFLKNQIVTAPVLTAIIKKMYQ